MSVRRHPVGCRVWCDGPDRGASAIEYGLLVAAIAAVIVAVVFSVGVKIKNSFDGSCRSIGTAQGGPVAPVALRSGGTTGCGP